MENKTKINTIGALLLTDSAPKEIKTGLWAKQATKDQLANTDDFRYSFKTSSLVCPFCAIELEGKAQDDPTDKKKPWEIVVDELYHYNENCPSLKLRKSKNGYIAEKILLCHYITRAAAGGVAQQLPPTSEEETNNINISHPLHDDPSVPKLHAIFGEEECEELQELLDGYLEEKEKPAETQSNLEIEERATKKESKVIITAGDKQRLFPYSIPNNASAEWEKTLKSYPAWSDTHPEDPSAPKISGWVVEDTIHGKKALCGYLFKDDETPELPESYPIPIFSVDGPEAALNPTSSAPIPYLEVELLCGDTTEILSWENAATVKTLKKKEKLRKKTKIQEELDRLPKEKIWEGFKSPVLEGIKPELDRPEEPQQTLHGYKPGGDVKKWWLPGIGTPYAKVWVIGLYPSNEEIKRKGGPKILSGASGEELFKLVRECGLDPKKDVFFENIVKRYMPPKSKLGAELKMEQTWLLKKELAYYKPDRVICLGADVYKEIAGNKSFQDMRGTWAEIIYPRTGKEEVWTGRVAGTFHPAGVLRPEGRHNLELFRHDLKELLLDKEQLNVQPTINEITTLDGVKQWVDKEISELENRGVDIIYSLDTEGYSLDVEEDELECLQISKIIGTFNKKEKRILVEEVPKHCDVLLFQENSEPEQYDSEVFAEEEFVEETPQMSLFDIEPTKESADEITKGETSGDASGDAIIVKPTPIVALANSDDEKNTILDAHKAKKKGRDLILFTPYKKVIHLKGLETEVGQELKRLTNHPHCKGFVITNANYDRIRLEKFLGWDLSETQANDGLEYPLDTMLSEHVLDENGDLGLKPCLNKHFNWPRQDALLDLYAEKYSLEKIKNQISNPARQSYWSLYPWSILKPYAAKDAYGTAALLAKQLEDIDLQTLKYQRDRLEENNPNTLEAAFHISCGAINGTYEMKKFGMPVGEKGMGILKELTEFYAGHETEMVKQYQDAVFKLTGLKNSNPSSPEELSYVLFNENSPLRKQGIEPWKESGKNGRLWSEIPREERGNATASTDAESLEIIASNCTDPELQQFLLRLSETKTILTIRSSFLPNLDSTKGIIGRINKRTLCMHTTYTPTLDTNRCRSVPNLSTFPKEETKQVKKILGEAPPYKIREIIQAPPGTWLLNRDWTTAEVLGVGYLSQDINMLKIISKMSKGMDFHCKLAVKTYKKIQETFEKVVLTAEPPTDWLNGTFQEDQKIQIVDFWKETWKNGKPNLFTEEEIHKASKHLFKQERSNIKPVTFGVPYGREAPAIMKALNREYYVKDTRDSNGEIIKVTLEEAQSMIDSYKTEFPDAWGYLVSQAEHAKEYGYLRDHWGYVRHFPQGMKEGDMTRKAYNYQVQHIVAVLMNQAMNDWTKIRKERKLKSYAYATLYDNIGWVVYEDELQEVWDISMEVMTKNRPIGPEIGDLPILNKWSIPTDGSLSKAWDGEDTDPTELGIELHKELNLTGLEDMF